MGRAPSRHDVACTVRRRPSASAPHPAPSRTPVEALLPHAPAPLGSWESAQAVRRRDRAVPAGRAPRTAGPTAAPPPYARRPRRPNYGRISGVTATPLGSSSPIKAGPTPRTHAAVLPHYPPPATIRATAATPAPLVPGTVRATW
jgi:hypothetical protein